jgi:hypothetical protein
MNMDLKGLKVFRKEIVIRTTVAVEANSAEEAQAIFEDEPVMYDSDALDYEGVVVEDETEWEEEKQ